MVDAYTAAGFQAALDAYKEIDAAALRENLAYFLRAVVPVAPAPRAAPAARVKALAEGGFGRLVLVARGRAAPADGGAGRGAALRAAGGAGRGLPRLRRGLPRDQVRTAGRGRSARWSSSTGISSTRVEAGSCRP